MKFRCAKLREGADDFAKEIEREERNEAAAGRWQASRAGLPVGRSAGRFRISFRMIQE